MSKQKKSNQKADKNMKPIMLFSLAAIAIVIIAVIIGTQVQNPNANQSEVLQLEELSYDKQPLLGEKDAPIKIVEFGDYKCPACQVFDEQIFPQIEADFITDGTAAFYFMNFPFIGADSTTAALGGEAVYEQDKEQFWKFHHALFKNQGPENEQWATTERILEIAETSTEGLDMKKLKDDIEEETFKDQVTADKQVLEQYGFKGTPTVFINGKEVENPFDYNEIKSMIEEALKEENE
jgi:protein-disulfide isomerase